MNTVQIDRTITDWLNGRRVDWATFRHPDACLALTRRLDMHGIAADLLPDKSTPPQIAQHVVRCRATQAFWETEHREIVADIVEQLHHSGIGSLVIKGTALAYSVYSEPSYRSRSDTDLVIRPHDRAAAEQILRDQGFTHHKGVELDISRGQQGWHKAAAMGAHVIDLHWWVMNSAFLNSVFDFEGLLAHAEPLPRLSSSARAPRRRDSLAIACVHRMIHLRSPYYVDRIAHYEPDRLIWLRDIDLLMRAMDQSEHAAFATEAADRGIVLTCHDAAVRACATLGTPMPAPLDQLAAATKDEKVDRFLSAGETVRTIMDIGAKKGVRAKARHLGELLFPSRRFMRDRFRGSSWPLGLLYVRRALGGILERLSGQQHRRR